MALRTSAHSRMGSSRAARIKPRAGNPIPTLAPCSAAPNWLVPLIGIGLCLLPVSALIVAGESHYSYTLAKSIFFRIVIEALLPLYLYGAFRNRQLRPLNTAVTWAVVTYRGGPACYDAVTRPCSELVGNA